MADTTAYREPDPSLLTVCHVTYALHALGLAIGAFGAATVVGSFLFGWPSIIAVIINYVKRSDARGTWLESHFTWQIRTFWFAMLWARSSCAPASCWPSSSSVSRSGSSAWPCWASGPFTGSRAAGCACRTASRSSDAARSPGPGVPAFDSPGARKDNRPRLIERALSNGRTLGLLLLLAATPADAQPVYQYLRLIAPAAPGGGWDQTARAMQAGAAGSRHRPDLVGREHPGGGRDDRPGALHQRRARQRRRADGVGADHAGRGGHAPVAGDVARGDADRAVDRRVRSHRRARRIAAPVRSPISSRRSARRRNPSHGVEDRPAAPIRSWPASSPTPSGSSPGG